jgi:hypothetical protein
LFQLSEDVKENQIMIELEVMSQNISFKFMSVQTFLLGSNISEVAVQHLSALPLSFYFFK